MTEKRIQLNQVIENQLPSYVKEDYPLIASFLKQYYISQEYEGGPSDLIQNIDRYIKLDNTTNKISHVGLKNDVGATDSTIFIDTDTYPAGTDGFPKSYGLLKIDDEIVTYTGTSSTSFTGCVRGFVGISSYKTENYPEHVVFNSTTAQSHIGGSKIDNLSVLFLDEFLKKTKKQFLPGLSGKKLIDNLNQNVFIKQSKDFYNSRGTDKGFKILFKALYGSDVEIGRPGEFTFRPSDAYNVITDDLVVEPITGNPKELELATLFQPSYGSIIDKSYAPITDVEEVPAGIGVTYYKLSVDAGYNRDIGVRGSTYGTFVVHPKTKLVGSVSAGNTTLTVDSTVGFGNTGELRVTYNDETIGKVSYTDKTLTEFYGCSNITGTILDSSTVGINTLAHGVSNVSGENIEVRICSVLSKSRLEDTTQQVFEGSVGRIQTLGDDDDTFKTQNWCYNVPQTYKINEYTLADASNSTYTLNFNVNHNFHLGDTLVICGSDGVSLSDSTVSSVQGFQSIQVILGAGVTLDSNLKYIAKRRIKKASFVGLSTSVDRFNCNIQNVYKQKKVNIDFDDAGKEVFESPIMVASPSLPAYKIETDKRYVTFSGTFSGDNFQIVSTGDHGFYTGDAVYYTPQKDTNGDIVSSLFEEGLYFVKRMSATNISLSRSVSNIYNQKYVTTTSKTVDVNTIESYSLRDGDISSQKLLRKFSLPKHDNFNYPTVSGSTGILINGVEIENYKSPDFIKYGKIESVDIIDEGANYDIVSPPPVKISDNVGTGAKAYATIEGHLDSIDIIDPGYDFQEVPIITITGGNGSGAKASASLKLSKHSASFPSAIGIGTLGSSVGIGLSTISEDFYASTIGFSTYHKLRNSEEVTYITDNQTNIAGLTTNAVYYVSVVGPSTVRLHNRPSDAISGINTVYFTGYGIGEHSLKTTDSRKSIQSIIVNEKGSGYADKKKTSSISGINTSTDVVTIKNHTYQSGEIIKYTCTDTVAGGLTNNTEYYVTSTSDDSFRLSECAVGSTKDLNYQRSQYVDITSVGVGTHIFNYPDINVEVTSKVRQYDGNLSFLPEIRANFKGSVKSLHLSENGVGYGSSEVLNFDRQPDITLLKGSGAQLQALTFNGIIKQIIVTNQGSNYTSPPLLDIQDDGEGASIVPVIEDGKIIKVNVLEGGSGYVDSLINVISSDNTKDVSFNSNIQTWNVNLFEKVNQSVGFNDDDGYITLGLKYDYGLQYKNIFAPRKLRESVYSVDSEGNPVFGSLDLTQNTGLEVDSTNHSPIIGWSYDGNPIYGPYGYTLKSGGSISQMKSGYSEDITTLENRPPTSKFASGFFIEDYKYTEVSDEDVLDRNNGRFCVTPEFPKGTYAYFATFDTASQGTSASKFAGYKKPLFPYIIGESYKSFPEPFNFKYSSNQDDYDLVKDLWSRNTTSYNLIEDDNTYDYINIPNKLSQTITVTSVRPGVVESIGINSGGTGYKINDYAVFDTEGTGGSQVSARVSRIGGVGLGTISVSTNSISNVEIHSGNYYGDLEFVMDEPHNFTNTDIIFISGLSTTSTQLEGFHKAGINSNSLSMIGVGNTTIGLSSATITGIVTSFSVTGNIDYNHVRENDILGIGTEQVKVLNIDESQSIIRVLRAQNGTVGSAHSVGSKITEDPRRLYINTGIKTTFGSRKNRQIYFEPESTVSLGTTGNNSPVTIGIGITIDILNGSLYIPNHQLMTGDKVTYSPGNGTGIQVKENTGDTTSGQTPFTLTDGYTLYVAKLDDDKIGLSTTRVGLSNDTGKYVGLGNNASSRILYFTGIGTGVYHSVKTNFTPITANISRNLVKVETEEDHNLTVNDKVFVDVNPSITETIVVKYNDYNRRIVFNPKDFVSSGVTPSTDTITITGHGFLSGDKVIHTAITPTDGLVNDGIYYIYRIDDNNFKLTSTYYDATTSLTPSFVNIGTSVFDGTISNINPSIKAYRNSTVIFDLTDSSLSYIILSTTYTAFTMDIFSDEFMVRVWDKPEDDTSFSVVKSGIVGTDGYLTMTINSLTPSKLFYKFTPVFESTLPTEKKEIVIDYEVTNRNTIEVSDSLYNGEYEIYPTNSTSFTYTVADTPEKDSYSSILSSLSYDTTSTDAVGKVTEFEVTNKGRSFYSLPQIIEVSSGIGTGVDAFSVSESIGRVQSVNINDIGFDFPSDQTLKPSVLLNQNILIDPLYSIDYIGITSVGSGYTKPPKLVCFDPGTKTVIDDVDLTFKFGDDRVTILKNSYGIGNRFPIVIPTENTNGVGISTISFNSTTKDVTVTLNIGFSNNFPFSVGDKVLVENISLTQLSSEAGDSGYNSEDYNYELFDVTAVTPNLGGIDGTVTYNISGDVSSSGAGVFDKIKSSGRIVNVNSFPLFEVVTDDAAYSKGETVTSTDVSGNQITGLVNTWDPKAGIIRVSSNNLFVEGNVIKGLSSKKQSKALTVTAYRSYLDLDAVSTIKKGVDRTTGVLNLNSERIQDSDYYQNFSYTLKSEIPYETWNIPVSSLTHTMGFKKFSDYQLISVPTNTAEVSVPGLSAEVEILSEIPRNMNLNSVYDFDLVTENSVSGRFGGGKKFSDQITFESVILGDYVESIGNRVISFDDISGLFDNNARPEKYTNIRTFLPSTQIAQKYIVSIKDVRYTSERQIMIADLLNDGTDVYLNQYALVSTLDGELGSLDSVINSNNVGELRFHPVKYKHNDYQVETVEYSLDDALLGVGSTTIGDTLIQSKSIGFSSSISGSGSVTISEISSYYSSAKVMVEISADSSEMEYEFNQLNITHDGSDIEVTECGRLNSVGIDSTTASSYSAGLGTYHAYYSGSSINVDFYPKSGVGIGTTAYANSLTIGIGNTTIAGISTLGFKFSELKTQATIIPSSGSPTDNTICSYPLDHDCGWFMVQIRSSTETLLSEIVVVDDYDLVSGLDTTYMTEFGYSGSVGLGTFGSKVNTSNNTVELQFTPIASTGVTVNVFGNALRQRGDYRLNDMMNFTNSSVQSTLGYYEGTISGIKRTFPLTWSTDDVWEKSFDTSTSVDVLTNTVKITNHYFVTGEEVSYIVPNYGSPIGIDATTFPGVGSTTLLPSTVFIVKLDNNNVQFASSSENALKNTPVVVGITSIGSVGIHSVGAKRQNSKCLITIDNRIQSPMVATAVTTNSTAISYASDDRITVAGITSFRSGDIIQINDEIMRVNGISGNDITVYRKWMGTGRSDHPTNSLVTKLTGDYNIIGNNISFVEAPLGNNPFEEPSNHPYERDWTGISGSSSFDGRAFLRSGIIDSDKEPYAKNVIYDDISDKFDSQTEIFNLEVLGSDTDGQFTKPVSTINGVYQLSGASEDYLISEVGSATSITYSTPPVGGKIVSVSSVEGFGYQPLVSAGGTATVSGSGTITAITIGNAGSGYRSGVQTTINVGVQTFSEGLPNIEIIGTASVTNGSVASVSITNPGSGYSAANPPLVVIDSPLSYNNIPHTTSGNGIGAKLDIVVGQGSSVIDFTISDIGYGYKVGDTLTLSTGGTSDIQTTASYNSINSFKLSVTDIDGDRFGGFTLGEFEILDDLSSQFDGSRSRFILKQNFVPYIIQTSASTGIVLEDILLIFINGIIQQPGESYSFTGGSNITFLEPPKDTDKCVVLFWAGSGPGVDIRDVDVVETVKPGDNLSIENDATIGQGIELDEDERSVFSISSIDIVDTDTYFGPGRTQVDTLTRPITWTRQTEDRIINGIEVTKDRELYEPLIIPTSRLIKTVGVGVTVMYLDSLQPFFNPLNEAPGDKTFQKGIIISGGEYDIAVAIATANVSSGGTITDVIVGDGGKGYTTTPTVSIGNAVGYGSTATATASVTAGVVTSITLTGYGTNYSTSSIPKVLISPPVYNTESSIIETYEGDSGSVVGFGKSTVSGVDRVWFDLHIPLNSPLRNTNIVSSALTISTLSDGDVFVVSGSNVGSSTTSVTSKDPSGNTIGIGISYMDNVYYVDGASDETITHPGIGNTSIRRVFCRVTGLGPVSIGSTILPHFGNYSWGKIFTSQRLGSNTYTADTSKGVVGLSTSSHIKRSNSLKFKRYI